MNHRSCVSVRPAVTDRPEVTGRPVVRHTWIAFIAVSLGAVALLGKVADAQTLQLAGQETDSGKKLTIGSAAPALDIEHYLSDGEGFFEPVTDFEEGKVYVVEFWATWCGPCRSSMPHLAELQQKYRGQAVQLISVTDEDLETVEPFLETDSPVEEKTFGELTSAYTLAADPDGSVSRDYMEAAGQAGIPASFLVGKTGEIEWIGHPMELDGPLEQVLTDTWDREAFKRQLQLQEKLDASMKKVAQLAGSGQFADAIKVIDKALETVAEVFPDDDSRRQAVEGQLNMFRFKLRLDSGDTADDVIAYFRDQMASAKGNPREVIQMAYGIMGSMQQGADVGSLGTDAITAIEAEIEEAPTEMQPLMFVVIAQLHVAGSDFESAIAAGEKAVEASDGNQKSRMKQMVTQLREMAEQATGDDETE
ncbi:MAG: TlpA disulfide reductase family protein [Planctomycetota bacterium]